MRKMYNVLVAPGGSTIAQEVYYSLRDCKNINLFSINLIDTPSHESFIFKNFHTMAPFKETDKCIEDINKVCKLENIDFIIPCNDEALYMFSMSKELHVPVLTSPIDTITVCRLKSTTYDFFKKYIHVPYEGKNFPVFIKPDLGTGSKNTHIINNYIDLGFYSNLLGNNRITMEYLPGDEYTVDCFSDREKGLLFAQGRKRVRISGGVAVNCILPTKEKQKKIKEIAQEINKHLIFYGPWFFQLKEDKNGILILLEINPRIAGSMSFTRTMGVNFPLLSIYEHLRIPIEILTNNINNYKMDKCLVGKYRSDIEYDNVYIDLDDTIILKEKVNPKVISFLYQCLNKHKSLSLLTKHESDPVQTLIKYHIDPKIFTSIIHIPLDTPKDIFITCPYSILIDDSFSERYETHKRGIPTFDVSMLDFLIDERK